GKDGPCLTLCGLEQLGVADNVRDAKIRHAGLTRSEEFSGAARFQIELVDLKAVIGIDHGLEPALAFLRDFAAGHQNTIGFGCAAPDASAQLMQLSQSEAFGVFDHHHRRVRDVDAYFDHCRCDQNMQLASLEHAHDLIFQVRIQTSVEQSHFQV